MNNDKIAKTKALDSLIIECEDVDFAPKKNWGQFALIEQAEQELGFKLPESYKWWVNHYKGGAIGFDQELYTIENKNPGVVSATDIVSRHKHGKHHPSLPANALVFFAPYEGSEVYFFEVDEFSDEYSVSVFNRSERFIEPYAKDFIEFMIKFITINYPCI